MFAIVSVYRRLSRTNHVLVMWFGPKAESVAMLATPSLRGLDSSTLQTLHFVTRCLENSFASP